MWSISYGTCVDIIAQASLPQWSIFLFLVEPSLKLRIIILPTDQPNIILPTVHTTRIMLPSANSARDNQKTESLLKFYE